mmetsp:Transcript_30897/g.91821  ORF Transcript_30897/g.91821 Transcript_30897/m.91821 type:complete len:283 (-) Transcript_30897:608-1456(-)
MDLIDRKVNIHALTERSASSSTARSVTEMWSSWPKDVLILFSLKTARPSGATPGSSAELLAWKSQNHCGASAPSSSRAFSNAFHGSREFINRFSAFGTYSSNTLRMVAVVACTGRRTKAVLGTAGAGGRGRIGAGSTTDPAEEGRSVMVPGGFAGVTSLVGSRTSSKTPKEAVSKCAWTLERSSRIGGACFAGEMPCCVVSRNRAGDGVAVSLTSEPVPARELLCWMRACTHSRRMRSSALRILLRSEACSGSTAWRWPPNCVCLRACSVGVIWFVGADGQS